MSIAEDGLGRLSFSACAPLMRCKELRLSPHICSFGEIKCVRVFYVTINAPNREERDSVSISNILFHNNFFLIKKKNFKNPPEHHSNKEKIVGAWNSLPLFMAQRTEGSTTFSFQAAFMKHRCREFKLFSLLTDNIDLTCYCYFF